MGKITIQFEVQDEREVLASQNILSMLKQIAKTAQFKVLPSNITGQDIEIALNRIYHQIQQPEVTTVDKFVSQMLLYYEYHRHNDSLEEFTSLVRQHTERSFGRPIYTAGGHCGTGQIFNRLQLLGHASKLLTTVIIDTKQRSNFFFDYIKGFKQLVDNPNISWADHMHAIVAYVVAHDQCSSLGQTIGFMFNSGKFGYFTEQFLQKFSQAMDNSDLNDLQCNLHKAKLAVLFFFVAHVGSCGQRPMLTSISLDQRQNVLAIITRFSQLLQNRIAQEGPSSSSFQSNKQVLEHLQIIDYISWIQSSVHEYDSEQS